MLLFFRYFLAKKILHIYFNVISSLKQRFGVAKDIGYEECFLITL